MNDYMYLIDNNALSKLTAQQRVCEFFRRHCRIPSEVLHEARWFTDIEEMRSVEYPMSAKVLTILGEVMATVPVNDTKLLDLYANRGNADPILVACAVDAKRANQELLFGPTWVIVSDDKAVRSKADEFGIDVLTGTEFKELFGSPQVSPSA